MYLLKRFLPQLIVILILCVMSGVGIVREHFVSVDATAEQRLKIIIDAGHGGLTNTTH